MSDNKGNIKIGKVRGDVVISNDQQGGTTVHSFGTQQKRGLRILKWMVSIVAILSGLAAIFTWMHWFPFNEIKKQQAAYVHVPKQAFRSDSQLSHLLKLKKTMFKKKMKDDHAKGVNIGNVTGDVVISQDQHGGITAHTVNIHKTPNRILQNPTELISKLKSLKPVGYRLQYSTTDNETITFAHLLDSVLQAAGWKNVGVIQQMFPPYSNGIRICSIKETPETIALANYLWVAFNEKGVVRIYLDNFKNIFTVDSHEPIDLPEGMEGTVIIVGPNAD